MKQEIIELEPKLKVATIETNKQKEIVKKE